VEITVRDDNGNICDYDFSPVTVRAGGALVLSGAKKFSLNAGKGAFYLKGTESGKGEFTVECGDYKEGFTTEVVYEPTERF
jgi:hypothetical protein